MEAPRPTPRVNKAGIFKGFVNNNINVPNTPLVPALRNLNREREIPYPLNLSGRALTNINMNEPSAPLVKGMRNILANRRNSNHLQPPSRLNLSGRAPTYNKNGEPSAPLVKGMYRKTNSGKKNKINGGRKNRRTRRR